MPPNPRVVIVDDHELFREGVRARLDASVDIVGEAGDVNQAIATIRASEPAVVLLDVHMPGGGGLAVLLAVARELTHTRFLALSVSDAPEDVIELVHAGARGYVTKTISPDELIDAVHRVADGDAVFSPRLAGFVLDPFADSSQFQPAQIDPELSQLTMRERDVAYLQRHSHQATC